jgi:hypothetical protein
MSEGLDVTYRNLFLAAVISSPGYAVWQWLSKRSGRISDLGLQLGLSCRPSCLRDDKKLLQKKLISILVG